MHQVIDAQLLQLQHDRAQVGPQDLRVRVVLSDTGRQGKRRKSNHNELVRVPMIAPDVRLYDGEAGRLAAV